MPKELPSPEELRKLLRYEPDTGKLFWKTRSVARPGWNARYAGKEAFVADNGRGYKQGSIHDQNFFAHRVIWMMITGAWPKDCIDHINGDKADNRIENLREATHGQNSRNKGMQSNNTSGYKGIYKHKTKWVAQIMLRRENHYLGLFNTAEDAHAAYCDAAAKFHGKFARTE